MHSDYIALPIFFLPVMEGFQATALTLTVLVIRFRHYICSDVFMLINSTFTLFSMMPDGIKVPILIKSPEIPKCDTENKKCTEKNEEECFVNANLSRAVKIVSALTFSSM